MGLIESPGGGSGQSILGLAVAEFLMQYDKFSTNIEEPVVISELSKYPSSSTKVDKADRARKVDFTR